MDLKVLAILVAGHFVTDINTGALPAFLPFIKESLSLSYALTASIILVFNVTSSVIQPVFGYFSDRWSAKWLLPVGCLIAPLGLGLLGFSTSFAWILFFAALSGLGQASYHPEGFKTVNLLSGGKKATSISFFRLGGNLGFALGPILATAFYAFLGLKGSILFLIPGIAMLVIFLTTSRWKTTESPSDHGSGPPERAGSVRKIMVPMTFLLLTVILRSASRLGLLTFIPFYFIHVLGRDPMIAGKYLSVFLLSGTVGTVAGGPFADRFGYKRTVLIGFVLSSLFLYLFFFTQGTLSLVFFISAGLTIISSNSVTMAIGQSLMPRNLGMAAGLILGLGMGIGGITTTFLGWMADHWGVPFALQITFILPIFALLAFMKVPYPAAPTPASVEDEFVG